MFVFPFYLYFVLENEDASPNEYEELFGISDNLLSHKREDAPLVTLPDISGPCKIEPDTQELGTIYFDVESTSLTLDLSRIKLCFVWKIKQVKTLGLHTKQNA